MVATLRQTYLANFSTVRPNSKCLLRGNTFFPFYFVDSFPWQNGKHFISTNTLNPNPSKYHIKFTVFLLIESIILSVYHFLIVVRIGTTQRLIQRASYPLIPARTYEYSRKSTINRFLCSTSVVVVSILYKCCPTYNYILHFIKQLQIILSLNFYILSYNNWVFCTYT